MAIALFAQSESVQTVSESLSHSGSSQPGLSMRPQRSGSVNPGRPSNAAQALPSTRDWSH
jgi:hypothetical protein